ncbi:MAG: GNAT family N-acetyltransferase [Eubacteriales bacterium]|nr:GNAT family N-acetyltransferase [Eubacteriales bacterium]
MEFIKDGNRFYMGEDKAKPLAEITYVEAGNHSLVVDHTFTDPSLRGQGIARKLVERVADYARENNLRLVSTCPYAKRVLEEAAFSDVYAGR